MAWGECGAWRPRRKTVQSNAGSCCADQNDRGRGETGERGCALVVTASPTRRLSVAPSSTHQQPTHTPPTDCSAHPSAAPASLRTQVALRLPLWATPLASPGCPDQPHALAGDCPGSPSWHCGATVPTCAAPASARRASEPSATCPPGPANTREE
jgi:hypothetical protein